MSLSPITAAHDPLGEKAGAFAFSSEDVRMIPPLAFTVDSSGPAGIGLPSMLFTQLHQHLQSAIAAGGFDPGQLLEVPHRHNGVVPDPMRRFRQYETGLGEAGMHLLDLGKRQHSLGAGKRHNREWFEHGAPDRGTSRSCHCAVLR